MIRQKEMKKKKEKRKRKMKKQNEKSQNEKKKRKNEETNFKLQTMDAYICIPCTFRAVVDTNWHINFAGTCNNTFYDFFPTIGNTTYFGIFNHFSCFKHCSYFIIHSGVLGDCGESLMSW
ncbi:hypothetical protein POVWA2_002560 [Plasmodium ovale wallikeri]|uniref:Uncharacterized protein n=1 Tax=Plasmodium ovale wallikeri TaxID=864142 RepID=A0A1A8YHX0_PLAOA|nr:hypothetical protein POVWA2_002560 [Plasmodium ovale wallikeri]SBT57180.1 hypothetical protein POVWA1_080570 [Plasmodium ovale wallikeri]